MKNIQWHIAVAIITVVGLSLDVSGAADDDAAGLKGIVKCVATTQGTFVLDGGEAGVFVMTSHNQTWDLFTDEAVNGIGEQLVGLVGAVGTDHPLVAVQSGGTLLIKELSPTAQPVILAEQQGVDQYVGSTVSSFYSSVRGCVARNGALFVTETGGKTWSRVDLNYDRKQVEISTVVRWLSESEVVVGSRAGSVSLIRLDAGGPTRVWTSHVAGSVFDIQTLGPADVLVGCDELEALSTGTGAMDAELKRPTKRFDNITVAGDDIYLYGVNGLSRTSYKGGSLAQDAPIGHEETAAVMATEGSVLVVNEDGVYSLKNGALTKESVKVQSILPAAPTGKDEKPTDAELTQAMEMSAKFDGAVNERIWSEANAKTDVSPRQRVLWIIDQYKKLQQQPATAPDVNR